MTGYEDAIHDSTVLIAVEADAVIDRDKLKAAISREVSAEFPKLRATITINVPFEGPRSARDLHKFSSIMREQRFPDALLSVYAAMMTGEFRDAEDRPFSSGIVVSVTAEPGHILDVVATRERGTVDQDKHIIVVILDALPKVKGGARVAGLNPEVPPFIRDTALLLANCICRGYRSILT